MKYSRMYIPTLKENMQDSESLNYRLLSKAGYLRKSAAGVYSLLPLGTKAFNKLQASIALSLQNRGCFEIKPGVVPGMDDLSKLLDIGRVSYKELPIGAWFVQEQTSQSIRPRLGLLYPKVSQSLQGFKLMNGSEELGKEFEYFRKEFAEVIKALGIEYLEVHKLSEYSFGQMDLIYFLPYSSGEERIARCKSCGKLISRDSLSCEAAKAFTTSEGELQMVYTPSVKTIQEVAAFLGKEPRDIVKTLIYKADDRVVAVLIRGDRELSEVKLKNVLGCINLTLANPEEVYQATGAEVGFAGPVGIKAEVICDNEAAEMKASVIGANKTDNHYINACIERDYKVDLIADIRCAENGDSCPECGSGVDIINGFTLAKLDKREKAYAKIKELTFINNNGVTDYIYTLAYEINLYRLLAAAVESSNDEAGIRMPRTISPFDIVVMPVHADNEQQASAAQELYELLKEKGFDVLLDDRNDRVSSKFKDSELIGIPLRITAGRKITEGIVEVKPRIGDMQEIHINDIIDYIISNEVYYAFET